MKNLPYIAIPAIAVLAFLAQFSSFASISGIEADKREATNLTREISSLKAIKEDEKDWANKKNAYDAEINTKKTIIEDLEDKVLKRNRLQDEIERLDSQITEKRSLAAGLSDAREANKKLLDDNKSLKSQRDSLDKIINEKIERRSAQLATQTDLTRKITELQIDLIKYEAAKKQLSGVLDSIRSNKEILKDSETKISNNDSEIRRLDAQISDKRSETDSLEAKKLELANIKTEIAAENAKKTTDSDLDEKIAEKRLQLGGLNGEITSLTATLEALRKAKEREAQIPLGKNPGDPKGEGAVPANEGGN
jgi:chromosome segregation ATPase